MKRILFTLIALFATVSLAHTVQAQTLSYNSPSPDSVLFSKFEDTAGDSTYVDVSLYIIKGFKADKDGNGFDCNDPYILKGDKELGGNKEVIISTAGDLGEKTPFYESIEPCDNGEHQWSFDVNSTYDGYHNGGLSFYVKTEDGSIHTILIIIYPMDNHDALQQRRVELWGEEEPINTGYIQCSKSGCTSTGSTSTSSEAPQELPNAISLKQNYPNPFNPQTTITYQIDSPQHVRLDVFNTQGQRIQTLVDGMRAVGLHSVRFDAGGLPSGLYVYRLQASGETLVRKMMLVR